MKLSGKEKEILSGSYGPGAARAMKILQALGHIHDAPDTVPVGSVQVSGVSYGNIGEYGLSFLEEWASAGSRVRVPAFMNPGGADMTLWKNLGFPAEYVQKQERVVSALQSFGVEPSLTCAPYHDGIIPAFGEHIAWAESSAVCYANSVLGARTNREGGPSALAAALTGRTPRHTMHVPERRLPTRLVRVNCPAPGAAEAGALGVIIGRSLSSDRDGGIPYITGTAPPAGPLRTTWLKALGAGMAASGSIGLFHMEGTTPEAIRDGGILEQAAAAGNQLEIDALNAGYGLLATGSGRIDLVALGCPHYSTEDLELIASMLEGKEIRIPLWIFVSRKVREAAASSGLLGRLERTGALLVSDTCIVVAPLDALGIKTVATDSAKAAFYLPSHQGARVHFGGTEVCVEAALRGDWSTW